MWNDLTWLLMTCIGATSKNKIHHRRRVGGEAIPADGYSGGLDVYFASLLGDGELQLLA